MTAPARKRVRNPYRPALRTYLRWPLILVAILEAIVALIAGLVLAIEPPPRITFEGIFAFALCLMYLGIVVAEHLKEVLSPPDPASRRACTRRTFSSPAQ